MNMVTPLIDRYITNVPFGGGARHGKDILRLAAILLVICGIAAACVGTAHDQTAPLIEACKAERPRRL